MLVVKMDSPFAMENYIESPVCKSTYTPYWSKFKNGILVRCTYHELKASEIIVELYHKPLIGMKKMLGTKIIPLKDVVDVSFAKSDMIIHQKKNENEDVDSDDLDRPAQTCEVQGTISIGTFPKHRQKGEDELIAFREQYLCIKVNEANVFNDINDGGDVEAWVQVNWGGIAKDTRHFKR